MVPRAPQRRQHPCRRNQPFYNRLRGRELASSELTGMWAPTPNKFLGRAPPSFARDPPSAQGFTEMELFAPCLKSLRNWGFPPKPCAGAYAMQGCIQFAQVHFAPERAMRADGAMLGVAKQLHPISGSTASNSKTPWPNYRTSCPRERSGSVDGKLAAVREALGNGRGADHRALPPPDAAVGQCRPRTCSALRSGRAARVTPHSFSVRRAWRDSSETAG
jgi:hypothetical protein